VLHLGEFKAGDTFGLRCVYEDLTLGDTVACSVRKDGALVQALSVTNLDYATKSYNLSAASTQTLAWIRSTLRADIKYTRGAAVVHTESFEFDCVDFET
jgi:hypothetical protein